MTKFAFASALAGAALLAVACNEASAPAVADAVKAPMETTAPAEMASDAAMAEAAALLAQVSKATYEVEKTHAFLFWSLSHMGLSTYTAKFTDWDASIEFDPEDPTQSKVTASINPVSVQTDHPSKADAWHDELANDPNFFNAVNFPKITFASTSIEKTGPMTGVMTGDLSFLGVTKPVTLDVTFNGVANMPWYGERDLIGFAAKGSFKRSDFGMTHLVERGIGDEVTIQIDAEFLEKEAPVADAE